jgi:hypothetical protein
VEKRPDRDPESRRRGNHLGGWDSDDFLGLPVENMSPRAQAVTGVVSGGLILLAAALLIAFTHFWWLIFVFGWAIFPAFRVFATGVAGLVDSRAEPPTANSRERELLGALQRRGELTPAQAAMETSLTVNEADEMLEDLAAKGHLDVRVRGGGLFYGLWEADSEAVRRGIGDE